MKKIFVTMIAMILCVSIALAECVCMTGDTKVALYDILNLDGIECDDADHDAIVAAYLGIDGVTCSDTKIALLHIMSRNNDLIVEHMSKSKIEIIEAYIGHCGCSGCGAEEEELHTMTTVVPTATPRPGRTPKPSKPTTKVCQHTGGTHENGGVCTTCGTVYQSHVWGSWTTASADAPHKRVCSCGYIQTGKHSFSNGEKRNNKVYRTCGICGYSYWGGIYTTTHEGCGCKCGGCKRNGCSNCSCGCGAHG